MLRFSSYTKLSYSSGVSSGPAALAKINLIGVKVTYSLYPSSIYDNTL